MDVLFVGGASYGLKEAQTVGGGRFVRLLFGEVWEVLLRDRKCQPPCSTGKYLAGGELGSLASRREVEMKG